MSDAASDDSLAGVTYWGCTSKLHRLCLEAEQKPIVCSWDRVIDFMITNPQDANETAVIQEGQLKLTPLGIACQGAPPEIVKAILEVAPQAIKLGDKYACLPIHRAALQNRLSHATESISILLDADPSTLMIQDGWGRTPLMCGLDSGMGVASPDVIQLLIGDGRPVAVRNKKGKLPSDIISSKQCASEDDRSLISVRLSSYISE